MELLGLHNLMGQSRVVNIFLRLVYILLLLFLWRTLMQTQRVNVFGFVGCVASAIDTQPCCRSPKPGIDKK